jgi:hypothetical protein
MPLAPERAVIFSPCHSVLSATWESSTGRASVLSGRSYRKREYLTHGAWQIVYIELAATPPLGLRPSRMHGQGFLLRGYHENKPMSASSAVFRIPETANAYD